MFANKPIIGIIGGIGSGKSYVSRLFGELGCFVIDSDQHVTAAYKLPKVQATLRSWWGESAILPSGQPDRSAIAKIVFADPKQLRQLENLLHPIVARLRDEVMTKAADDPNVLAYVWDTPLLVEAGLARQCDALIYVDAPEDLRFERVRKSRGWTRQQWLQREKSQLPLDNKRKIAEYIIRNTADVDDEVRNQVRDVLSRILAEVRR